jgi:hypothetical protein
MLGISLFYQCSLQWGRFWYGQNYQYSQPTSMGRRESLWCNLFWIPIAVQHYSAGSDYCLVGPHFSILAYSQLLKFPVIWTVKNYWNMFQWHIEYECGTWTMVFWHTLAVLCKMFPVTPISWSMDRLRRTQCMASMLTRFESSGFLPVGTPRNHCKCSSCW